MNTNNEIEFLAIGDTVVDAFIRLNAAEEEIDVQHHTSKLALSFGDKVPYEFKEVVSGVGNSPNAAVSAARLGLKTSILTNVGDDMYGKDCLDNFQANEVDVSEIKINPNQPTNYHYVLWFHADRTILIKHEKYQYVLPKSIPKWIYLSSLSDHSLPFHQELSEYLKENPDIKVAFQPGTFQMTFGTDALADIYKRTEIFFCNVEEANRILKTEETDVKVLMKKISELGPKIVVITDGPNGSYVYDTRDNKNYFLNIYPDPKSPYERTGAGDSFSSTFTAAIELGQTIPEAMRWGSTNSMSVVQYIGAQKGLLKKEDLEKYLSVAPEDWNVKEI